MTRAAVVVGNILGAARAEADATMLATAFVETADYRALVQADDFNLIVGRRGTGKSALFFKLGQHFADDSHVTFISLTPVEHEAMELQRLLQQCGSTYRQLRALSRLVWKVHLLMSAARAVQLHYRASKTTTYSFLSEYLDAHRVLVNTPGTAQCNAILKFGMLHAGSAPYDIPAHLATALRLEELKSAVEAALRELTHSVVVAYDGLDEGWEPEISSTAILGGLALAAADLVDAHVPVRPVLFIRDNMFRALAKEDNDFTRHVEGNTLRLHWDEASLFHFVAMRLRSALSLHEIESDVKVWNRFANRDLKDREGFRRCLYYTLYRPRDILVLLNDAFVSASREGRDNIVESDIDNSSRRISQNRLADLLKEYDVVLPGLKLFVDAFRDGSTVHSFSTATGILDKAAERADDAEPGARDFALFGSGREVFFALYSVGFFGVFDSDTHRYTFCHDGSASTLELVEASRHVAIHPCYWKALDLQADSAPEDVFIQINDEYDEGKWSDLSDVRTKRLGTIIEDLSHIAIGFAGHAAFEKWVLQASKILFAPALTNIQLKANPANATQQRDVVATNMATAGFWRRIREDYGTRQVTFECKNYEELKPEDFRQMLSYMTGEYGRFAIVVTRANNEVPSPVERSWLKTMYFEHQQRFILVLPAEILSRCIRKLRNPNRRDYTEDALAKRMDTFIRSYLSLSSGRKFRKKRPSPTLRNSPQSQRPGTGTQRT